jgi:Xaa-Pro aminopeptidase
MTDVLTYADTLRYRHGFGGCRVEDLVRVGESGAEPLTEFPYDLEP